MTKPTTPKPIRITCRRGDGMFDGYAEVDADIARQIVAMVLPEDMRRMCADLDVAKLEARIAALEARAQSQDRVDGTIGALLMPPPVEVPPGQRSRNPILDNYTQPAAPDADEAAVEALKNIEVERGNGDDDGTHMEPLDLADWQINGILAAIRSGAIQLPEDAPQIAALRAEVEALKGRKVKLPAKENGASVGSYAYDEAIEACESAIRAAGVEVAE